MYIHCKRTCINYYRIAGNFRWCKFSHEFEISLRIKPVFIFAQEACFRITRKFAPFENFLLYGIGKSLSTCICSTSRLQTCKSKTQPFKLKNTKPQRSVTFDTLKCKPICACTRTSISELYIYNTNNVIYMYRRIL